MKKFLMFVSSGALAVSLAGLGGCSKDPMKMMEEMANEVCACKDQKCVDEVTKKFAEKGKDMKVDESKLDQKKVEEVGKKMAECMMKVASGGAAAPAEAK